MMFRTLSDRTTIPSSQLDGPIGASREGNAGRRTFILANVLQRKRQARVFPLDDAHLAKGSSTDDAKQAEVI